MYADYDADGVTACALLQIYLKSKGAIADHYIPERESEGYGLNEDSVRSICSAGVKLIITADTGISALNEAKLIKELGADLIITDHHEPRDELPEAAAVINPKQKGCTYPYKYLAGVGVAFKLACALEGSQESLLNEFGELVALGTLADIVPVSGENREFVSRGLELMRHGRNLGLRALLDVAGIRQPDLTSGLLSFAVAPRINAAGRMGSAGDALRLLTAEDQTTALALAEKLDESNRQRKEIENRILAEAIEKINENGSCDPVIMVCGDGWHSGVIGIVASRIMELYAKPAVLVAFEGNTGKASCRSFPGFSIYKALANCGELLEQYGGHELAAGFIVRKENYAALYKALQYFAKSQPFIPVPSINLEYEMPACDITLDAARECKKLEPFGAENPEPLFFIKNARVLSVSPLKEGRHIRLDLKIEDQIIKAVMFNADRSGRNILPGAIIDCAVSLSVNFYNGRESLSVILRETRVSCVFEEGRELYKSLLLPAADIQICKAALPDRNEFAAVYHYLFSCKTGRTELKKAYAQLSDMLINFSFAKLLIILEVFSEVKLITFSLDNDEMIFEIDKNIKVNLEESRLLSKLSGQRQSIAGKS